MPTPALFNRPKRQARPVRPAVALVQTIGVFLLVAGAWGLSLYGLHWFSVSQAHERLRQIEANFPNASPTAARLKTIGCYYRGVALNGGTPSEQDLTSLWSDDCLTSPRGGKIVVVWGLDLSGPPGQRAPRLLAFEAVPDSGGKRWVLTEDLTVKYVSEEELQALRQAVGR